MSDLGGARAVHLDRSAAQAAQLAQRFTNFFKTELELGRCLRLPPEGPCECDLYLTCAKFVTTPEYAPRLRARREVEETLALDAAARGWDREVERRRCTTGRIEKLLTDLGEPLDNPGGTPGNDDAEN